MLQKFTFSRVYFIPLFRLTTSQIIFLSLSLFIFPFLHISRKHLSRVPSPKHSSHRCYWFVSCIVGEETCLCAGNTHDHSFRFVCLMVIVITRFAKTRSLSECTVSRLLCSQDAEGSNFAIWSNKWTPCDINVEIKKKKPFAQTSLRIISNLVLYSQINSFWILDELERPQALQPDCRKAGRQSDQVSLLAFCMGTDLYLPSILSGPHAASPTSKVTC